MNVNIFIKLDDKTERLSKIWPICKAWRRAGRSFTRREANSGDALGFESLARRFESRGLPGEILPARHGNIDICRMQLDRMAGAAGHFRCDNRGAGSDE